MAAKVPCDGRKRTSRNVCAASVHDAMKTIIQINLAAWLLCNGGQHEHTSTEAPTSLDAQLAARPLRFCDQCKRVMATLRHH